MFMLRSASRPSSTRFWAAPLVVNTTAGATVAGRRYAQQGYGDDSDASIADTPEARNEKSEQGQKSQKQGGNKGSNQPQKSTSGDSGKQSNSKSTAGAQPKILDQSPPPRGEEPPDVAQHNKEMSSRADQAHEKVKEEDIEKDKVGKRFWSGAGGVDRDP